MLFLPDYYGIELSESFPILTVTRMMLVVFCIYALVNRKKPLIPKNIHISQIPKRYYLLAGYFILRILSNLYYVGVHNQALKVIISIIFEQLFFLYSIYLLSLSKAEIDRLLIVIVWVSAMFYVIGIFESLTYIRPFDSLYTVSRYILNEKYIRLGFLRSTTTFGIPGIFANMCTLSFPIILFVYNMTKKKRYLTICFYNILSTIHSGCRSNIFFFIAIFVFYLVYVLYNKADKISFLKNATIIILSLTITISTLCMINPLYRYFYFGSGKALLNEIGFDFDLDEGAPDGVLGYGPNSGRGFAYSGGVNSRKLQLSGIPYALNYNFLFGLGSGALDRDEVKYLYINTWIDCKTIDLGIVEVIIYEGFLGAISFLMLFIFLFIQAYRMKNVSPLYRRLFQLMIVSYLLSSLSTVNMMHYLMLFTFLILFYKGDLEHENNVPQK
jgi:hypothetical protein